MCVEIYNKCSIKQKGNSMNGIQNYGVRNYQPSFAGGKGNVQNYGKLAKYVIVPEPVAQPMYTRKQKPDLSRLLKAVCDMNDAILNNNKFIKKHDEITNRLLEAEFMQPGENVSHEGIIDDLMKIMNS